MADLKEKGLELPEGINLKDTMDVHDYVYNESWTEYDCGIKVIEEECKWYGHDDDMTALSKKFPDVLFTLRGEGEEPGDLWVTYYKKWRISK